MVEVFSAFHFGRFLSCLRQDSFQTEIAVSCTESFIITFPFALYDKKNIQLPKVLFHCVVLLDTCKNQLRKN